MIRNYRAALERDPDLDKARLGLAEQLSKDRRFDEAEQEYRAYLRRNPRDASAMVGLGRNAFQDGDIEGATRQFEAALAIDPRQRRCAQGARPARHAVRPVRPGAADGSSSSPRSTPSTTRSAIPTRRPSGSPASRRSRASRPSGRRSSARSTTQIVQLRFNILKDPNDLASRCEVARWMFEHGHADEGLKWAKEILRADPRHAGIHRALADYYAAHGNPGLANYHRTMASSSQDAR